MCPLGRTTEEMLKPLIIRTISLYDEMLQSHLRHKVVNTACSFFRSISATVNSDLNSYEDDCIDVEADGKLSIDEWSGKQGSGCRFA